MKILIFTSAFYPNIGGIESLTLNLIDEFKKSGHEVKVVTEQKQTKKLATIDVYPASNLLNCLKLFFWCDVFYMPNISLKGIWLLWFNPRKKWIISHNDFSLRGHKTLLQKTKRYLIKHATHNISVSQNVASSIDTQSHIIYNCYDDSVFKVDASQTRTHDFVFVGRLVSQKGVDTLIKACNLLNKPFNLNIIGIGPEQDYLQKLVADYKLQDSIKFLGLVQHQELAAVLNRHRTLVIPSINEEGFGIVALEGMACGCKVIGSDAGGLKEAINGFGKFFEMRNVEQLAQRLNEDLDDVQPYSLANQTHLQAYLADHSKSVTANKYLELFSL